MEKSTIAILLMIISLSPSAQDIAIRASSNLATQIMLTSKFRITADHADEVQSMTYSVSATHLTIR